MKTIMLFIYGVLFNTYILLAQSNIFSRILYDSLSSNIQSQSISSTTDNCFVISGIYNNNSCIIKIDSLGFPIWNKTYYSNTSSYFGTTINYISETKDTSIVIAGNIHNSNFNIQNIFCAKLNRFGDTLWSKVYSKNDSTNIGIVAFQCTKDSGYVLLGHYSYNQPPWANIFIFKINATGNLQWTKSIIGNIGNWITAKSIKQTNDGGYIITGNNYKPSTFRSFPTLIKLNSIGETIWAKEYYQAPNYGGEGLEIEVTNDGFICNFGTNGVTLLKIDFSGNVVWAKSYQVSSYLGYLRKTYNGFAILGGSCGGSEIIVTDSIGNILWSKYLLLDYAGVAITNEKGLLVIGNGPLCGSKDGGFIPKIGLIKIDSLGITQDCASQIEYTDSTIYFLNTPFTFNSDSGGLQSNFQIYIGIMALMTDSTCVDFTGNIYRNNTKINKFNFPEFNNGIFTINYEIFSNQNAQFKVYDNSGKTLFETILNSQGNCKNVNCNYLQNAIYLYRIVIDNNIEKSGKFVILK